MLQIFLELKEVCKIISQPDKLGCIYTSLFHPNLMLNLFTYGTTNEYDKVVKRVRFSKELGLIVEFISIASILCIFFCLGYCKTTNKCGLFPVFQLL